MDDFLFSLHDFTLVKNEDAEHPNRITVTAALCGKFNHPAGKFEITPDDLNGMVKNFTDTKKDLLFDYDHKCLDFFSHSSRAAGWGKSMAVDGDKLKIDVDFTEEGFKAVNSGEYKYLSPVYHIRKNSKKDDPRVILHSVALTNIPFLKDLPAIKNNNLWRSKTMDLKELAAKLKCAETDESVVEAINSLIAKCSSLEAQNGDLNNKLAESDVNVALAQGKFTEAQKTFALNLRKSSQDLFNQYIANSTVPETKPQQTPPTGSLSVPGNGDGGGTTMKFSELMKDSAKMEAFKLSNPVEFEKMYTAYIENGGE